MAYRQLTQSVHHVPSTFLNTLLILPHSILGTLLLFSFYQQGAPTLRVTELNVQKPWLKPGGPDSESAWSLPCTASSCRANRFAWIVFVFLTEVIHLNAHTNGISAVIRDCDWKLVASESHTQTCIPSGPRPPPLVVGHEHCSPSGRRRDGSTLFNQTKIRLD